MRKVLKSVLAGALALALAPAAAACGGNKAAGSGAKREVCVSAAASLTDCVTELGNLFMKENPEAKLLLNFGSSGKLQQQIEQGAPADVFISAGQKQMNALEAKDLVDKGSRVNLLKNEVVLIVPKDSKLGLKDFRDVTRGDVKMVAIGEASVPAGQYAEEIFRHLGIWDAVTAKANYGQDVRNVLAWVEEGQADCGVVYATDAAITDKVKIAAKAPDGSHKPVIYPAAVMKNAAQPELAKAFMKFIKSDEAAKVFERCGFTMAK